LIYHYDIGCARDGPWKPEWGNLFHTRPSAYVVESAVEEADAHVVHDQKDIDIPPVVVLDNQWAQDQKEELTEIIVSNNNHQTNMTADAQAA
jgi:hypothetical protein